VSGIGDDAKGNVAKRGEIPVSYFRWIFLGSIAALYIVGVTGGPVAFGESIEWSNGHYHISAGTSPGLVAISAAVLLFYLVLLSSPTSVLGRPLPGIFRRFVAGWLDFTIGMIMLVPLLGVIPALVEWHATGEFQWLFERTTPAPWDGWVAGVVFVLLFGGMLVYVALPLMRGTPSPGSCIMGYRITTDDGSQLSAGKALVRTLAGFVALFAWFAAPARGRDGTQGKIWPDKWLGTKAVQVK
jgi:uncharacterized RDD family membrane protein YckC